MYLKRDLEDEIKKVSKKYPVVVLCGQRQIGKSTMLYNIKEENRKYVSLDDINARKLASEDPELFFETYGYPLIIDEFQRVPSILLTIKKIVDEKKLKGEKTEGMFWLTGSERFVMMKDVSESLAGRVAIFDMTVLSIGEQLKLKKELFNPEIDFLKKRDSSIKKNENYDFEKEDVHKVFERIFNGNMPKIIIDEVERERYYRDYVNTYLERDIRELTQVGNLDSFYQFLVYMASITGKELKYESISKEVGVSAPTIKNWVTILERFGIIYILRPYHSKATDRLVKTPKVYFMDTGLAAYLTRWPNAETLESSNMAGAFFETYVVTEIIKNYINNGKELDLYYYRDIDKKEIDLLIVKADTIYPIEIKKSKNPSDPDRNFDVLKKFKMNIGNGLVICLANELMPLNRQTWIVPVRCIY